jgi:molybdopterin synthase catalytic subunit
MVAFFVQSAPLDRHALQQQCDDATCGGFVCFEGWVRNHHEGDAVAYLEYEAFAAMCITQGTRLLQEACTRFGVTHAVASHRTGRLEIGELAVWVGVSAPHRAECFAACQWLIDTIKHELPVWKKEWLTDASHRWVRCEACAHSEHAH